MLIFFKNVFFYELILDTWGWNITDMNIRFMNALGNLGDIFSV